MRRSFTGLLANSHLVTSSSHFFNKTDFNCHFIMFTLSSQITADFTLYHFFVARLLKRFKIFFSADSGIQCYYLQSRDEFTTIMRYLYHHNCLMIAESTNWKVVCGVT